MDEILELACLEAITTDDIELILLNELIFFRSDINVRSATYGHFNFDKLGDEECRQLFRFKKTDMERLRLSLRVPDVIITTERYRVTGNYKIDCFSLNLQIYEASDQ